MCCKLIRDVFDKKDEHIYLLKLVMINLHFTKTFQLKNLLEPVRQAVCNILPAEGGTSMDSLDFFGS